MDNIIDKTPIEMRLNPLAIILITLISISVIPRLDAQKAEIGFSIGATTYQGDISPLGWRISFEGAQVARGLFLSLGLNDYLSVKGRYYTSNLAASDENAISSFRSERNLHFRSSIREFSLVGELNLLGVFPSMRKFKFQPFVNVGVGVFRFNPEAKYKGVWHELQPLGTEGQGLPGSDKELYSLTQLSIPMGVGMKYTFNDELVIAFEIAPRWTFTDYLDDVSTTYPDLELLGQERGDLAVGLSYRSDKPIDAGNNMANVGRGNSGENDWYVISTISVAYRFDPGVYYDRRKGFQGNWKCPYF